MKIVISGFYGAGNLGDEAILSAILNSIRKVNPEAEFTVLSMNPSETEIMHTVHSVLMPDFGFKWFQTDFKKILKVFCKSDLIIVGGGGLLQDAHHYLSIPKYLQVPILAKLFKKPVIFYSVGVGPVKNKINRILVHAICNITDLITVRDPYSKDFLISLGVSGPSIILSADPVFLLEPVNPQRAQKILEEEGIPTHKPLVGVSVRNIEWTKIDTDEIAKFLDYIVSQHDSTIVFIPFGYDGIPTDLELSEKIKGKMREKAYIIKKDRHSPAEIMGIIGELNFLIGMRLHSIIMAGVMGIPVLGIAYLPKVESALKILGYKSDYIIKNISDMKVESMKRTFGNILKDEGEIKENNRRYTEKLKDRILDCNLLLKEIPNKKVRIEALILYICIFIGSTGMLGFLQLLQKLVRVTKF